MKFLLCLLMLAMALTAGVCFFRQWILGAWLLIGLTVTVYVFLCTTEDDAA